MRLVITCLALTGCVIQPLSSDGDDTSGPGHSAPAPVATGTYHVSSTIDLTLETVLPQPVEDIVVTARDFSTNPAHTLISLADDAGVPAVGTLRSVLPSYVMGKLEGWMNDEIAKLTISGVPVTQVAGTISSLAETTLTQVSLESDLTISGGTATHRLTVLDLAPTGIDKQFSLGGFPSDSVSATATATSSRGTLAIGDHTFGLAYGEYAWEAIEAACTAEYGADLRATLGVAVGCSSLAARVANKCVLGVCVGHQGDLTEICEAGLDEVVGQLHDRIVAVHFDAIHFSTGTATIGATGLSNGMWTAEINAGQGLRHVPATFTATH